MILEVSRTPKTAPANAVRRARPCPGAAVHQSCAGRRCRCRSGARSACSGRRRAARPWPRNSTRRAPVAQPPWRAAPRAAAAAHRLRAPVHAQVAKQKAHQVLVALFRIDHAIGPAVAAVGKGARRTCTVALAICTRPSLISPASARDKAQRGRVVAVVGAHQAEEALRIKLACQGIDAPAALGRPDSPP